MFLQLAVQNILGKIWSDQPYLRSICHRTMNQLNWVKQVCTNKSCRYCLKLVTIGHTCICNHNTHVKFGTRTNISCKSNNLIYAIECTRCGMQYVGQTMNSIADRFRSHFYGVTSGKTELTIPEHLHDLMDMHY